MAVPILEWSAFVNEVVHVINEITSTDTGLRRMIDEEERSLFWVTTDTR